MPEQLTEEDLKKMSPEEIAELQKKNCIFCHIAEGKVPAKKVFEDDKVLAILDIYPAAVGHILLIPKEHHAIMPQVPDDLIIHMGMVAKALSQAMLRSEAAKATTIFIANGAVAGQKAPHFMIHIIPRKEGDNINLEIAENKITSVQLDKIRSVVLKRLAEIMKKKESELVKDFSARASEMEKPQETKAAEQSQKALQKNEQKPRQKTETKKAGAAPAQKESEDDVLSELGRRKGDRKSVKSEEDEDDDVDEDDSNEEESDEDNGKPRKPNLDDIANLFG